jgi:8-oxo-dGTP diphosphatase
MAFTYKYARPALSVDIVVFGISDNIPSLLVIKRGLAPFKGRWALPGGFVRLDETLEKAARRELLEETSMKATELAQLSAFSQVDRDPRERVVTVAFFAMVNSTDFALAADTDADEAKWIPLHQKNSNLAFDHEEIVKYARAWLIERLYTQHIALKVLPKFFTLTQAQQLYEGILNTTLDKRNFRKAILNSGLIQKTKQKVEDVAYRAPFMFTLKKGKV